MSSQNDCSACYTYIQIFSEKLLTNLAWKSIIVNESRYYPIDGCLSEYKFYVIASAKAITSFLRLFSASQQKSSEGYENHCKLEHVRICNAHNTTSSTQN